jgi:hypothetical protein
MSVSRFIVLVHADRAPLLLGPMSIEMRSQHVRELHARHPQAGLHELDIQADGPEQVTASISHVMEEAA